MTNPYQGQKPSVYDPIVSSVLILNWMKDRWRRRGPSSKIPSPDTIRAYLPRTCPALVRRPVYPHVGSGCLRTDRRVYLRLHGGHRGIQRGRISQAAYHEERSWGYRIGVLLLGSNGHPGYVSHDAKGLTSLERG